MGLLNCKKHGKTGVMPYVSKDICQYILNNEKIDPLLIKSVHVLFFDEEEVMYDRFYYFSARLFDQLSLKNKYEIVTDEDELKFSGLVSSHFGSICIDCFKSCMKYIGYKYKL